MTKAKIDEEEGLLSQQNINHYNAVCDSNETIAVNSEEEDDDDEQVTYSTEFGYILRNSIPNCVGFVLQYCINAFSVLFVSKLGEVELAANALAVTTFFVTGPSLFMGMATAIDTLCSQAYGAKKYGKVGLYFQKNVALSLIIYIPLLLLWTNIGFVLKLFVKDEKVLELVQLYFKIVIFEAPAIILYENGKRFIQAQGIFNAVIYILAIVVPINLILNYALILSDTFGIGYIGAPITACCSYWLMAILLFLYVRYINGSKCWIPINFKDIFHDLTGLIKLNIHGAVMILSESFAFELLTLMSSQFDVAQLAAQSVTVTIGNYFFQIPFAVGVVGSMRIGHRVGSGDKLGAIIATRSLYLISIILGFTNFSVLFLFRFKIASYFANGDSALHEVVSKCLIVVAIFQMMDCGFNICSAAILRAQGRQKIGSILSFISYYIVGLFFEFIFGFYYDLKLFGLWCGLALGLGFLSINETYFIINSNWDEIIRFAGK